MAMRSTAAAETSLAIFASGSSFSFTARSITTSTTVFKSSAAKTIAMVIMRISHSNLEKSRTQAEINTTIPMISCIWKFFWLLKACESPEKANLKLSVRVRFGLFELSIFIFTYIYTNSDLIERNGAEGRNEIANNLAPFELKIASYCELCNFLILSRLYPYLATTFDVAPRGGIEPPTPAFSEPRSTTELPRHVDNLNTEFIETWWVRQDSNL